MPSTAPPDPTLAPLPPHEVQRDRDALARVTPKLAAIDEATLPPFNLEPIHSSGKAIVTATRAAVYRDLLLTLPTFAIAHLDGLEDLGRALRCLQTEIQRRLKVQGELPGYSNQGYALRGVMLDYCATLSRKNIVSPELVERVREGAGYLDLVQDLNVLVAELEPLPLALVGEATAVTRDDLRKAAETAHQIHVRLGEGAAVDLSLGQLHAERHKLGALLVEAHGEVREAIGYLRRREGDVDTIAPSIYVANTRKRPAGEKPPPGEQLARLHEELHAHDPGQAPVDPEDYPFTTEE